MHRTGGYLVAALAAMLVGGLQAGAATTCENLASLALPQAKIDSAQMVPAGTFMQPGGGGRGASNAFANLPAFCRVTASLTPTSDSDIKTEIWLPASGWNGSGRW
jgi:feruloyl esterase